MAPAQTPHEIAEPQGSRQCQTLEIARVFSWQFGHWLLLSVSAGRVGPGLALELVCSSICCHRHCQVGPQTMCRPTSVQIRGRQGQMGRRLSEVAQVPWPAGWQSLGQGAGLPDSQPGAFFTAVLHRPSEHLSAFTAPLGMSLLQCPEHRAPTAHRRARPSPGQRPPARSSRESKDPSSPP